MDAQRADDGELLDCVFCQRLATDAVLLPCIHTACRECLMAAAAAAAAAAGTPPSCSSDGSSSPSATAAALDVEVAASDGTAAAELNEGPRYVGLPEDGGNAAEINGSAFSPRDASTSGSLGDSTNLSAISIASCPRRNLCPRCRAPGHASSYDGGELVVKHNRHISGRIRARNRTTSARRCRFCEEAGAADVAAEHRCSECNKFLCETCKAFHDKLMKQHNVVALGDYLSREAAEDDLALVDAAACAQHGRELSFTCTSCRDFKCVSCVASCDTDGHRYMTLAVAAKNAKDRIASLLPSLEVKLRDLRSLDEENQKRAFGHEISRAALMEALHRNKKSVLDMVAKAYDAAKRDVDSRLDLAGASAKEVGELTAELRGGIGRVCLYIRSLLDGGDPLSLVDQADVLCDCEAALLRRAMSVPTVDEVKLHVVNASLPNMADIVSYHVGQIRTLSDGDAAPSASYSRSSSQDGCRSELTLVTPFAFANAEGSKVSFALQYVTSYRADVRCLDIAVGFDGGAILVSETGIRKYDIGGRQLSVSRAECEYGSVTSHNGHRFAAWNYTKQKVEIFNRDGHVAETLKALGRVAVAEDGKLAAANSGGVTLFDPDGQQLLHIDYSAHNDGSKWLPPVAVRHRSLVLALQPPSANGGSAIVTFDYQGRQRWRLNFDEPVYGLCCDGWGNVFVALHDSNAVRAISAEGKPLGDVLTPAHGLSKPWRVTMSGDSRWLAVLSADKFTVSVYASLIHVS